MVQEQESSSNRNRNRSRISRWNKNRNNNHHFIFISAVTKLSVLLQIYDQSSSERSYMINASNPTLDAQNMNNNIVK